jgi:hypothetical protein
MGWRPTRSEDDVLRWTFLVLAIVMLLAPGLRAQEPSDDVCPARPAAEKRAQRWAGRWFAKGEQASKEARFQEALDSFLCSLYLMPHQNTVFNVAQLTNLVQDKAAATASLKRFRAEHPGSEFDDELADLVVSLEKAQGIAPSEPEAPASQPPAPEAPTAEAESTAEPDATVPATPPEPKSGAVRTTGIVLIAAAGATLITGVILAAAAGAAKGDAEAATTYGEFRDREDAMKGRQAGAVAMFVVTGVLAGTGALMVGLGGKEKPAGDTGGVEVAVAPGPVGLVVSGRF